MFAVTKASMSQQNYVCHTKTFVKKNVCHNKHVFVMTKGVFCRNKHMFVATKIMLVAAPASDNRVITQ